MAVLLMKQLSKVVLCISTLQSTELVQERLPVSILKHSLGLVGCVQIPHGQPHPVLTWGPTGLKPWWDVVRGSK